MKFVIIRKVLSRDRKFSGSACKMLLTKEQGYDILSTVLTELAVYIVLPLGKAFFRQGSRDRRNRERKDYFQSVGMSQAEL